MNKAVLFAAAAAVLMAACAKKEEPKVSLSFQSQLDSGNAAYRRADYTRANEFYHQAAKSDPNNISGFYGIYMAESKLGNAAEAAKAKEIVAKMAPEMPLSAHPTAGETGSAATAMPANPHQVQPGQTKPELPLGSKPAEAK